MIRIEESVCPLETQAERDNVATMLTRMADKVRKSPEGTLGCRFIHSTPKRLDDKGDVVYDGNEEFVCRLVFARPVGAPVVYAEQKEETHEGS